MDDRHQSEKRDREKKNRLEKERSCCSLRESNLEPPIRKERQGKEKRRRRKKLSVVAAIELGTSFSSL
jgi:hypothetical protein